jgi:predicted amidohydrolase
MLRADDVVRVGLIQMDGHEFDKEYNLARAEALIRTAAARGAAIVCLPEVAVQGYPRVQLPPETSPDDPKIAGKRARILEAAEVVPGASTDRLSRLARELRLWIVAGIDENRGGRLFNSAILIDPEGAITGKYSKVHLQNWMLASGVNRGNEFPVWDVEVSGVKTKVGIQICYDIQHPESTRELALGGAEIVFVPYCTTDFSRPLPSSIIDFEGATQDELDRAEGVLVGNLNLTALRKVRTTWNRVYGPANRYPEAYRRLRAGN